MSKDKIGILRPHMTTAQIETLDNAADRYHRLSVTRKGGEATARFVADGHECEIVVNTDGTIEGDTKWVKSSQPKPKFAPPSTPPPQETTPPPRKPPRLSKDLIQARFKM